MEKSEKRKRILILILVAAVVVAACIGGGMLYSYVRAQDRARAEKQIADKKAEFEEAEKQAKQSVSEKVSKQKAEEDAEKAKREEERRRREQIEDEYFGDDTDEDADGESSATSSDDTSVNEESQGNGHVVVIDPGHQSRANTSTEPLGPGSSTKKAKVTGGTHGTTTGVYEYQLTLTIAKQLKTELEDRGYTVYLTRDSNDVDISNAERAQFANDKNADIYFRIHANGAGGSSANGAMMLYPTSSNQWVGSYSSESERLSTDVLSAYCAATGMKNLGNQPRDDMTGFNWAKMPMTLIELGFMTNPTDDRNMEDSSYQQKMVTGIADGIDKYFG